MFNPGSRTPLLDCLFPHYPITTTILSQHDLSLVGFFLNFPIARMVFSQWIVFGLILFIPLFFFPLFFLFFSMELHKALTLVDPTSTPPVTSTSLTPIHPSHHQQHRSPMAIPLQQLTVKPAMAPMQYISYSSMGLVDPTNSMAASIGAIAMDRKALTTKLRVGVTASALKAAERPKFAPY